MIGRKKSAIAEIRMKYQEKVSNPPPAGRLLYPVEIRIVKTQRSYGDDKVPLGGVPLYELENYIGKLSRRGYKVAICDQVGEVGKGHQPVERAVTPILTASTLSEPNLLPLRQNNYLAAIASGRSQTALAAIDVSTGEFIVTWFTPDELPF